MSTDQMRVKDMTVYDCARVEVLVDHENGCIQIICYNQFKRAPWSDMTLTLFGLDNCPPELLPVTYIDPPRDEDEDEHEDEKNLEYADKHGA